MSDYTVVTPITPSIVTGSFAPPRWAAPDYEWLATVAREPPPANDALKALLRSPSPGFEIEAAKQALADQAQELGMGYGPAQDT